MKTLFTTPCCSSTLPLSAPNRSSARRALARCTWSAALTAALIITPARADNLTDINGLVRSGQYPEALTKVDAGLVQTPRDKQLRFLKGVILTEQSKPNEAIAVFTKLTEDFPELPEPYNNLAVLFAAGGQYDKARAALEMAIRTNPTYATAHENLGDVYAKLASQAYDKALQLDSGNTTAKSKLTMIRTLVGPATGASDSKAAAAASTARPVAIAVVKAPVVTVAKTEPKVEIAKVDPKPKLEPKVVAKTDPRTEAKVALKSTVEEKPKAAPVNAEQDDVLNSVAGWARAWSTKDMASYLSYYTADFQPNGGQSHKGWADDRRARIEGKGSISVHIDAPKVTVDGSTATVKFRQQYVSDRLHSNGPKTLVLVKHGAKWQIKQEHAGS